MPKIRGLRRRSRSIERWRQANRFLNPKSLRDSTRPDHHKTCYVKLWLEPWGNLFATEQPKKGHRTEMLAALLDIYESWNVQLAESEQPYYLKVWLFEPHFMRSQVVCAWGQAHDHYRKTFTPASKEVAIPTKRYFGLEERLAGFEWKTHLHEHFYFESDFDAVQPDGSEGLHVHRQKLLRRLKSGGYASSDVDFMGKTTKAYAFPLGHVWVGGRSTALSTQ
ncbi:MAG: hypothetical protein IPO12_03475 [Flavobacteriales bacterium]|nr:hypothetical protein [Flavobacteriales bacterium]